MLSALFAIGSIRSSGICRILLPLYSAAVYVYGMIRLRGHFSIDAFSVTMTVYLAIQIVFAVLATKVEQNGVFGIRTPFTLDYKPVWERSHVFMSVAETATGNRKRI